MDALTKSLQHAREIFLGTSRSHRRILSTEILKNTSNLDVSSEPVGSGAGDDSGNSNGGEAAVSCRWVSLRTPEFSVFR